MCAARSWSCARRRSRCGRARSGAIVLLSSLDGLQAEHGMFSYCVSKGALLNLARAAALDLARERRHRELRLPERDHDAAARRAARDDAEWRRSAALLCGRAIRSAAC